MLVAVCKDENQLDTRSLMERPAIRPRTGRTSLSPGALILLSFAAGIVLGAAVLSLPVSLEPGVRLRPLDALFLSTSAICVTGLSVLDVEKTFSGFGELVLLVLVQLGGIGIVTAGTFAALAVGRRLGVVERLRVAEIFGSGVGSAVGLLRLVVTYSLGIQAVGFVALWLAWLPREGAQAAYLALFHTVSAFNGAGFSLYNDSLLRHAEEPITILIFSALILAGSLGFIVAFNLMEFWRAPRLHPLSLTTRLALSGTAAVVLIGAVIYALFEWNNPKTLGAFDTWHRIHGAFFMSVTRTAGFTNVDYAQITPASSLVTLILMFVGANPTSTGGGIKTVTFLVLVLATISFVRHGAEPSAFSRRIEFSTVLKALAVTFLGVQVVGLGFTALAVLEPGKDTLRLVFETVSAFGTVGLSMNLTPELSDPSRMVLIALMYVGRVGILTFALALGSRRSDPRIRYVPEDVTIG